MTVRKGCSRFSVPLYRFLFVVVVIIWCFGAISTVYGADLKPVQMDIAAAVSHPDQYAGRQVSFVGTALIDNSDNTDQIVMYGANADKPIIVLAKFKSGTGLKAQAGETFFALGRFSADSTPAKIVLEDSTGFSACRIVGQARDGKDLLPGVVFFTYPHGVAVKALDKGKEALIPLIMDGKMAGIGNAGGVFDVVVSVGSADLLALYTDPKHEKPSAIWIFSSDMPNGTVRMDLDTAEAFIRW